MLYRCTYRELDAILSCINDAAQVYRNVIPQQFWRQPYMSHAELAEELERGVDFWGHVEKGKLLGVMGLEDKGEVVLFRHAYVRRVHQRRGIGSRLFRHLYRQTGKPVLIGTWRTARWAVRFYRKHGMRLLPAQTAARLLRSYWSVPEVQAENSVVLANSRWEKRVGSEGLWNPERENPTSK